MKYSIFDSDEYLIENYYLSGQEKCLNVLILKHQKKIFNFIYQKIRCKTIANDISQETCIKIYLQLKNRKYIDNGRFIFWILRIANNLVMDHYRNNINKKFIEIELLNHINHSSFIFEDFFEQEAVLSFNILENLHLEKLPPEQREVLILRIQNSLKFKTIADIQKCKINTVLARYRYAVNKLKFELSKKKYTR